MPIAVSADEMIESLPEQGYALEFESSGRHEFAGAHQVAGAQCPRCAKPFLRLASLDAKDAAIEVEPAKIPAVHLLYCWTCSVPFGRFSYRINPDGSVEIVEFPEPYPYEFGAAGPYAGYTGEYPLQRVSLVPLTQDATEQPADDEDGELPWQPHQVGGSPRIANPEAVVCPSCSEEAPFFALIADAATGNDMERDVETKTFTGNPGTQMIFHLCRGCAVVTAYHSND